MDREDPRWRALRTEREAPTRTVARIEREEPRWSASSREQVPGRRSLPVEGFTMGIWNREERRCWGGGACLKKDIRGVQIAESK